jgi:hypothetical protein
MNKLVSIFLVMCLLLLCIGLSNCAATETGNPNLPTETQEDDTGNDSADDDTTGNSTDSDSEGDTVGADDADTTSGASTTEDLLTAVCEAITDCYSTAVQADCEAGLFSDDNVIDALGLDTGDYGDFDELQDGIDDGTLSVDTDNLNGCVEELAAVSCTNMFTNGIFVDGSGNYSSVYKMIPEGECEEIF